MKLVFLTFFIVVVFIGCGNRDTVKLQQGDLVFQDLDCGELCDAIEMVTTGVYDKKFSHVAIVSKIDSDGKAYVIEAYDGVSEVQFSELLKRNPKTKVVIGRLKQEYQYMVPIAVARAYKLLGKPYDSKFMLNNDSYYCSELIYEIFKYDDKGKVIELFPLNVMTFKDPKTGKTMDVWIKYFKELGVSVPEGESGINPGAISRSRLIQVIK